jgi:hypothetical protein
MLAILHHSRKEKLYTPAAADVRSTGGGLSAYRRRPIVPWLPCLLNRAYANARCRVIVDPNDHRANGNRALRT